MPEPGAAWSWLLPPGTQPPTSGGGDQQLSDQELLDQQLQQVADLFGLDPGTIQALSYASQFGLVTPSAISDMLFGQGGGGGGTDNSLGWAQLAESQKQHAFDRVSAKIQLLQATDQLQESRKENALNALTSAIPYLVGPGQNYVPGYEPGGVGMQLGSLLGANVQPQKLVRQQIPLGDYLNSPTTVTPDMINSQLAGVM